MVTKRIVVGFVILIMMSIIGVESVFCLDSPSVAGKIVYVNSVSIDEFIQGGYGDKIKKFAELDNVDKVESCGEMNGMGNFLVEGIDIVSKDRGGSGANQHERAAMLYNTWFLQQLIKCASLNNDNTLIYIPEGTYFFVSGHYYGAKNSSMVERHVIKPYDNITIVGAGTEIDRKSTVLKPYSEIEEFKNVDGGLDMFFFNDYSAYNQSFGSGVTYLKNNHFYNFVIDGEDTQGRRYNTSGKGFMINLFDSCTWHNITVRNTDGTGFGVDAPVGNSGIYNSRAIGNGKGVKGVMNRGGGSGFGIGTGYSDAERFEIVNSVAEGNGLFGFFYEHQNRFGPEKYLATSGNFKVINARANSNTWNYGGLRSNDSLFSDVESTTGCFTQSNGHKVCTERNVHFSDDSRNVNFTDSGARVNDSVFADVKEDEYYYDAVLWAEGNGLAEEAVSLDGASTEDSYTSGKTFGVGSPTTRADVLTLIWRMMGRPGLTVAKKNNLLLLDEAGNATRELNIKTCFSDVDSKKAYASAVRWAYSVGITKGTKDCSLPAYNYAYNDGEYVAPDGIFSPKTSVTRAEFITMLYRMNGSPSVARVISDRGFREFSDVKDDTKWFYIPVYWAASELNGEVPLTTGVGNNRFAPNQPCTREMVVAFLYRYWVKYICEENCPDLSELLKVDHNKK